MTGDFLAVSGAVRILQDQREAEIVLRLMPDSVPELEELYVVLLTAVEGGATLAQDPASITTRIRLVGIGPNNRHHQRAEPKIRPPAPFRVPANDEPHGVFTLSPHQQPLAVLGSGSEVSRALSVSVTRLAGLFGNASVGYEIRGARGEVGAMEEILGGQAEGRIFFRENRTVATVTVPISNQVSSGQEHRPFGSFLLLTPPPVGVSVCGGDLHDTTG